MIAWRLPRPDNTLRLLPAGSRRGGGAVAWRAALGLALLVHLLAGVAVVARPPAWLWPARGHRAAAAAAREAEVELVQNDMPANADAPAGGAGQTVMAAKAAPAALSAKPAARARQARVTSPDGAMPAETPAGAARDQPDAIRLDDDGDLPGVSGGSATTPGTPDPNAHNHLPAYPTEAARAGETGRVVAMVRVNPAGGADAVIVLRSSGWPLLDDSVVRTLSHWRFRPAVNHGSKTTSEVPVEMDFVN